MFPERRRASPKIYMIYGTEELPSRMNSQGSFGKGRNALPSRPKAQERAGLLTVSRCGQEILERTACTIQENTGDLVLRIEVGFPANGRTINAGELKKILFEFLPECVKQSLQYKNMDKAGLQQLADLSDDQQFIREFLAKNHLCAFVGNGSTLPAVRCFHPSLEGRHSLCLS